MRIPWSRVQRLPSGLALTFLMLLAVARTVGLVVFTNPQRPLTGDEPAIYDVASSVLEGRGITHQGVPWITRPPGWPLVVAAVRGLWGDDLRAIVLLQGLLDLGSATLWGIVAGWVWRSRNAGFAVASFVLLWPPFFRESRFIQTEPLFTFCLAAMTLAFCRFTEHPTLRRAFVVGLLAGIAATVRPPAILVCLGMIIAWSLFSGGRRHAAWAHRASMAAVVFVGLVLAIAPLTIRNAHVTGHFLPLSVGAGDMMFVGTMDETDGRWNQAEWKRARLAVIHEEQRILGRPLDPVEQDDALRSRALAQWRTNPIKETGRAIRRLGRLVMVPFDSDERPALRLGFLVALVALYATALPQGIAGLRHRDHGNGVAGALLLVAGFYVLGSVAFYANSRYMEPLRPLFAVLAAGYIRARGSGCTRSQPP